MNLTSILDEDFTDIPSVESLASTTTRNYWSSLIECLFDRPQRSSPSAVMVTAPHRKTGVSFICTSIAAELAAQSEKVLLIDAHAFRAARGYPLRGLPALCKRVGPLNLWVLGMEETGLRNVSPDAEESAALGTRLRILELDFTVILIDAPALSAGTDAKVLASLVRGTVMVARANRTRSEDLKKGCQLLTSSGGRILGSIFNAH
jgi:Mrp family chromosome partitioning ATPase